MTYSGHLISLRLIQNFKNALCAGSVLSNPFTFQNGWFRKKFFNSSIMRLPFKMVESEHAVLTSTHHHKKITAKL